MTQVSGKEYAQTIRAVDSEQYADYLKDVFTKEYYDNMLPCEDDPALTGSLLWKSEEEVSPWGQLAMAVISLAVKDYIDAALDAEYAKKRWGSIPYWYERRKQEIEKFFVENELDIIINRLQYEIRKSRNIEWLERRVRVLW